MKGKQTEGKRSGEKKQCSRNGGVIVLVVVSKEDIMARGRSGQSEREERTSGKEEMEMGEKGGKGKSTRGQGQEKEEKTLTRVKRKKH